MHHRFVPVKQVIESAKSPPNMWTLLRRISLTQWILGSMVAGALFGWWFPEQSQHLKVISTVFLKLIKCILVPLIFGTLVVGIAGHSEDLRALGRLALKSIVYFEAVTTLALVVGLVVVNLVRPGDGVVLPPHSAGQRKPASDAVNLGGNPRTHCSEEFFRGGGCERHSSDRGFCPDLWGRPGACPWPSPGDDAEVF
jgi:hypothetical protein